MVVADLHIHTTNSDGTLELREVPRVAKRAGLEGVAITDHDRLHPALDFPLSTVDDVTIIHGIELRVETATQRVDLLGYGARETDPLRALVDTLQRDRIQRAERIADCVSEWLEVDLNVSLEPGIGRPHIARAIDQSEAPLDYAAAFDQLIGTGCPCYVPRTLPSFERGRSILSEACALVSLAHPLRYPKPEAALELAGRLDAVELHYPYERSVDTSPVLDAIERHNLLVTGGSDAHDDRLGVAGLDRQEYDRFIRLLEGR